MQKDTQWIFRLIRFTKLIYPLITNVSEYRNVTLTYAVFYVIWCTVLFFLVQFEGQEIALDNRMGIFITMNPGYAGRTELPESVKALFRPVVVIVPDLQQICEIMLFSEGFLMAKVGVAQIRCMFVIFYDHSLFLFLFISAIKSEMSAEKVSAKEKERED